MFTAQTGFINALRFGSYLVAARITVYIGGTPTSIVLPVSDGTFTVDRNSEFRRSGQLVIEPLPTVPPQTVTASGVTYTLPPITPRALLAPFGSEVFVELSVVSSGAAGQNGWVPMGMYQIASTSVLDTSVDMTMQLTLYDRSWAVAQRALLTAYTVPATAGKDLQSEVQALINKAWGSTPPWTYNIVPSSYVVPAGTFNQGQDPWQACLDMAAAAGYELYFDVNGNVVGTPVPTPSTQPIVWNFSENEVSTTGQLTHAIGGTPYTTPVDVNVTMSRDGVPNAIYVSATGANNASGGNVPVQATAADTTPGSPTYVGGGMGTVPVFIYDSLITSAPQAVAEAKYHLAQILAKSWTIAVSTPVNPLFDIDDVVTVTRPRLGLNAQKFVIDTITTSIRYDVATQVKGRGVGS